MKNPYAGHDPSKPYPFHEYYPESAWIKFPDGRIVPQVKQKHA